MAHELLPPKDAPIGQFSHCGLKQLALISTVLLSTVGSLLSFSSSLIDWKMMPPSKVETQKIFGSLGHHCTSNASP